MASKKIKNIIFSAFFMALAIVLPFTTLQIREIGNMLLPMHLPIFLCGLICGSPYGLVVGFITPIFRAMIFATPILFPRAIVMACELATYGFISGHIYGQSKYKCLKKLYKALIISMISGRIVWALVSFVLYGISGMAFTLSIFITYAFINAVPGIAIQLILVPAIMLIFNKTYFHKTDL